MKVLSTSCGHMLGSRTAVWQRSALQGCSPAPPAAHSAACTALQWAAASACIRRPATLQSHVHGIIMPFRHRLQTRHVEQLTADVQSAAVVCPPGMPVLA